VSSVQLTERRHEPPAEPKGPARNYRPEIQGLRALAVLLVVVYHVWLGRVSGGVDIFLLISAFLITLSFTRKGEDGKPLHLVKYWLHLFKRQLPAIVVVLLAVLVATALLLPSSRWADIFSQTWASLLYFQNWVLANNAVDYYAADHSAASPLQHFWSLSIQGQVFILWPLIFAAAAILHRFLNSGAARTGRRLPATAASYRAVNYKAVSYRAILAVIFGGVFAASLAFSVWQTATNQSYAYFDTRTRLWEFALGSLLALALPYLTFGPRVRIVLGWLGLVAMVSCGLLLQVQQQFPGYVALWPTLAAACIIIAGRTGSRFGADRLLTARPLVRMGNNSYGLYLWHWPVLVGYLSVSGRSAAGLLDGAAIIGVSILLAVLTTRVVEKPVRSWTWSESKRRRMGLVIALAVAVVAAPLSGWQFQVKAQEQAVQQQSPLDNPGAAALTPGFEFTGRQDAQVKPTLSSLSGEWADVDQQCHGQTDPATAQPVPCRVVGDRATAARTILMLGDSHSMMWLSALEPVAEERGWQVVALLKMGCRYGAAVESRSDDCNAYNQAVHDYVLQEKPDAVVTVGTRTDQGDAGEAIVDGYAAGIQDFTAAGIDVVALRDSPRFSFPMPECIERNGDDPAACARPRADVLAEVSPLQEFAATMPGVRPMDMTDLLCTADGCPGVIGNVLVYLDHDHLSRSYVETTVPVFGERFAAALGWPAP
jgi:peptidoglycan/LPS O-acetylase OafA/YrhL